MRCGSMTAVSESSPDSVVCATWHWMNVDKMREGAVAEARESICRLQC